MPGETLSGMGADISRALETVNWSALDDIIDQNATEQLGDRIAPEHIVKAVIADLAYKWVRDRKVELNGANLGEILGASMANITDGAVKTWPKQYRLSALQFVRSYRPEGIANAYAALQYTFERVPALQAIPWHKRWEFIIDTDVILILKEYFGLESNPFMIALFDGALGPAASADDEYYAEAMAKAMQICLVDTRDERLTVELITKIHDAASPQYRGVSEAQVLWQSDYTKQAYDENMALIDQFGMRKVPMRLCESKDLKIARGDGLDQANDHPPYTFIRYQTASSFLTAAMNDVIQAYESELERVGDDADAKEFVILAFCDAMQKLHPFKNGNHRTFGQLLLWRCQIENGLPPSLIGMLEFETFSANEKLNLSKERQDYVRQLTMPEDGQ